MFCWEIGLRFYVGIRAVFQRYEKRGLPGKACARLGKPCERFAPEASPLTERDQARLRWSLDPAHAMKTTQGDIWHILCRRSVAAPAGAKLPPCGGRALTGKRGLPVGMDRECGRVTGPVGPVMVRVDHAARPFL